MNGSRWIYFNEKSGEWEVKEWHDPHGRDPGYAEVLDSFPTREAAFALCVWSVRHGKSAESTGQKQVDVA